MKTLILDFDGTIADTSKAILATVAYTLQRLDCPMADSEEVKKVIGLPLHDTFSKAANITDEAIIKECIEVYRTKFNDFCGEHIRLYPGVKSTLESLKLHGKTITVASSRGKISLLNLLKSLEIAHLIDMVIGEEDVKCTKPAPDAVNKILDSVGDAPENTLVVGDTTFDIEMGKAARSLTCGVTYGNHTEETLRASNPTYLICHFEDILKIMGIGE